MTFKQGTKDTRVFSGRVKSPRAKCRGGRTVNLILRYYGGGKSKPATSKTIPIYGT